MFPKNEILKVFKCESDLIFEVSTPKYPEYQYSAKSVKGFGSYEHLKCRPACRLKKVMTSQQVIVVRSPIFCYIM